MQSQTSTNTILTLIPRLYEAVRVDVTDVVPCFGCTSAARADVQGPIRRRQKHGGLGGTRSRCCRYLYSNTRGRTKAGARPGLEDLTGAARRCRLELPLPRPFLILLSADRKPVLFVPTDFPPSTPKRGFLDSTPEALVHWVVILVTITHRGKIQRPV